MKQMIIEKILELPFQVEEILSIHAENSITYQKEENGIRALGNLSVSGQVLSDNQNKEFQEVVTLDILAPFSKLKKEESFSISFDHYDAKVVDHDILIILNLNLLGIVDEEYADKILIEEENNEKDPREEDTDIILEKKTNSQVEAVQDIKVDEILESPMEMTEEVPLSEDLDETLPSEFEDLFDDRENTRVKTRLVKLLAGDSYNSIAERYQVDLKKLMEINRGKNLENCTLITLPND